MTILNDQTKKEELQKHKQNDFSTDLNLANTVEKATELVDTLKQANTLLLKLYSIHDQLSPDVKGEAILQSVKHHVHLLSENKWKETTETGEPAQLIPS